MSTELKARVHARLLASAASIDHDRPAARSEVRTRLAALLRDEEPLLAARPFERILTELVDEVAGLGPLEPLLADPAVTEVMVNGPGSAYVERAGRLERVAIELDHATILRLVERVVGPLGLRLDRSAPIVDARLPDGSRLHAVIPPLALDGPYVTIRRFGAHGLGLDAFGIGEPGIGFLRWAVGAGWNVVVSGGTGSGKTTLLNALSAAVPGVERVVTIEETAELRLGSGHVVRLEARRANAEGAGAVSVRDLVRAALRMRPDRIVVGEVRGPEALDMLQALNTGHDGSLTTVHANSAADVVARLETLVLLAASGLPLAAVRAQLLAAVDGVVHVVRDAGGRRRVERIGELVGAAREGGAPVLRTLFVRDGETLRPVACPSRPARRPEAGPVVTEGAGS